MRPAAFAPTVQIALALLLLLLPTLAACSDSASDGEPGCDQGSHCRDSDCDTVCDADEGTGDADGDGVANYLDDDSDGDGVSDADEAGDDDLTTAPLDENDDGTPDYLEADYPPRPLGDAGLQARDGSFPGLSDAGTWQVDAAALDGSGHYDVDAAIDENICPAESIVPAGCLTADDALCDALDQDCDGEVQTVAPCACARGEVRGCFLGPPGRRGVGACLDGMQVCQGEEFTHWGPCTGSTGPSTETCDGLDNDCNGCSDELDGCDAVLDCPAPGDPRIVPIAPYTSLGLVGAAFYGGNDATNFRWVVEGSPCDQLFHSFDNSATQGSGKLSYRVTQANMQTAGVEFSLSGSYAVSFTADTPDGPIACAWTQEVRAPGLRVELCWDNTGPKADAQGGLVDLDLHLGKQGSTTQWGANNDCHWLNCKGANTPWSYANTALRNCEGAQNGAVYDAIGHCPNPRLDADARLDAASTARYVTENVNLDAPAAGDVFRIAVAYNTNAPTDALGPDAGTTVPIATHPIVNVYCGGVRVGSLGGDPVREGSDDPDELADFEQPTQLWRVADVSFASGGGDAPCALTPLSAPAPASGYYVTVGDSTY